MILNEASFKTTYKLLIDNYSTDTVQKICHSDCNITLIDEKLNTIFRSVLQNVNITNAITAV